MTELTLKDRELLKLRSARMSAVSIAGLMGRGWTAARVEARLAEIDALEHGDDPPVVLTQAIDIAEDRIELSVEDWAQEHRRLLPALHPARLMMTRATPWEEAVLSFLEVNPSVGAQVAPIVLPHAGNAEFFALSWPALEEPCLETLPLPFVADEAEALPSAPTVAIDPQPQAGPVDAPAVPVTPPRYEPPRPKARAPRRVRPAPVPMAVPAPAQTPRAPIQGAVRLKRLTEKVVRWAGWFFAAGWDLYDIADLFDVDRDALEKVLT